MAFGIALLLIADSPPLAYNAILLAILALNGWSGFFLLRQLRFSLGTALAGGVLVEMLPLAADQLGVVQTVVLFPLHHGTGLHGPVPARRRDLARC